MVLVVASWYKGSNVPSIMSPVVDEAKIRTGHWLGLVHCVLFSVFTLMVR